VTLVPVDEHLARCLAGVAPLPPLDVSLLDALDCVLAEDVVSAIDLPAFDNWTKTHADAYTAFTDFQKGRIFKMPTGQYYGEK